jgi:hypothetical protein
VIPAAIVAVLLAGCGGGSTTDGGPAGAPSVASIPDAASSSSAAPVAVERPLIRMDTSLEEQDRLVAVWLRCLDQHGHPKKSSVKREPTAAEKAKIKSATAACASKEPEDYKFRLQRTDPAEYADSNRKMARCLKSHGLKIEVDPDGTWGYTDPARDMGSPFVDECEQKAFVQP